MRTQKIALPKTVHRKWLEIDASKQPLGRVATQIANYLRGKHKRDFTPHLDMGDFVVAKKAGELKLTGRKIEQKNYYRHSGYLGGLKTTPLKTVMQRKPDEVLRRSVFSMLDDVRFRKAMMSRLKIVTGDKHNYKIDKAV